MAKEPIERAGTIARISKELVGAVNPKRTYQAVTNVAGLLTGQIQRREYESLYRRYNAGLIKKAVLIAYSQVGTRHQRKIADKLLKEVAR